MRLRRMKVYTKSTGTTIDVIKQEITDKTEIRYEFQYL